MFIQSEGGITEVPQYNCYLLNFSQNIAVCFAILYG